MMLDFKGSRKTCESNVKIRLYICKNYFYGHSMALKSFLKFII